MLYDCVVENNIENEEAELIAKTLKKNLSIMKLDVDGNFSKTILDDIEGFCKRNVERQLIVV